MKRKNKHTGDIVDFDAVLLVKDGKNGEDPAHLEYPSLEAAMEEWEEYKEPEKYWSINCGMANEYVWHDDEWDRAIEAVGLKFDTKEECERAIEKLKAITRLKDKGLEFTSFAHIGADGWVRGVAKFILPQDRLDDEAEKDLDLLFGGAHE